MVIDQVVADAKNTMSMLVAQLNVQLPLDRANGHLLLKNSSLYGWATRVKSSPLGEVCWIPILRPVYLSLNRRRLKAIGASL